MTPLSLPLQQQWQAVVERLPFDAAALSDDARAVLTFSDFVREALSAHPQWLSGLEAAPPSLMNGVTIPPGFRPRSRRLTTRRR